MGQRVSYYRSILRKTLKETIFENFSTFRQWYLDAADSSVLQFNETFGNKELKSYLAQNDDFEYNLHNLDKKLIDELTSEFLNYCDSTNSENKILELFGPTMNKWRYNESTDMVLKTNDRDFIQLWNFIIKGRCLTGYVNFESFTNDEKIGFLTYDEYSILKSKIEAHFGNIGQIKEKYWTDKEKADVREAIANSKNGSYSLYEHNPKSSGLEYVLQALNEISITNDELITVIEL
ncbi:hypothetical protein [Mucilaginibacter sp.]|uniref:hypothetical protein n=1 Tax=Mucilaginibacter sp. TaxID=1882438 RepID=UPI0025E3DEBB|nr:hypothetical protein [Mucilaginibacter sp.]